MIYRPIHPARGALLLLALVAAVVTVACGDTPPSVPVPVSAAPTSTRPLPSAAIPEFTVAPARTETSATAASTQVPPANTAQELPKAVPPATSPASPRPPALPTKRPLAPTPGPPTPKPPTPKPPTPKPPTPKPLVKIVYVREYDFGFDPPSITVERGTKVVWTNAGPTDHTVADKDVTWSSDILHTGDAYSHIFNTPGTVTVICTLHPDMISEVAVK